MKPCILLVSPEKIKLYQRQKKELRLLEEQDAGAPLHILPDTPPLLLLSGFPLATVSESLPSLPRLDRPLVFRKFKKKYFAQAPFFTCHLKKNPQGFSFLGFSVDPPSFLDVPELHQVFALESLIPALLKKGADPFCVLLVGLSGETSFIAFNQGFPFALKKLHHQSPEEGWALFRRYLEKHHQLRMSSYTILTINDALLRTILALLPRHRSLNLFHGRKPFAAFPFLLIWSRGLRKLILPCLILLNLWEVYRYYDLRKETSQILLSLGEERKKIESLPQTEGEVSLSQMREVAHTWEELTRVQGSWEEAFITLEKSLKKQWSLFEVFWQGEPQRQLIFKTLRRENGDLSELQKVLSRAFRTSRISFESQGEEEETHKKLIIHIQEERDGS